MKPYPYYKTREINTLKDVVAYSFLHTPDKDAFRVRLDRDHYKGITWSQFQKDINHFGTALFAHGLKDTHICVIGENAYEWVLSYMTALCGGCVIVPLDRDLPQDKIKDLIAFSNARAVVFSKTYEKMIREIASELNNVSCFISMSGNTEFTPLSALMDEGAALAASGDTSYTSFTPDVEKMAAILFTSGTSGLPKGVILSQKSLIASFDGARKHISFAEDDVMLSVLPLHHAYESGCGILAMLRTSTVVCFNENLKLFLSNLKLFRPTGMSLVPLVADTLFRQIMEGAKRSGKLKKLKVGMKISDFLMHLSLDMSDKLFGEVYTELGGRFKKAFVGGASMNPVVTKAFRQLGITMLQGLWHHRMLPSCFCQPRELLQGRFCRSGTPCLHCEDRGW